jgi:hypothetical protein
VSVRTSTGQRNGSLDAVAFGSLARNIYSLRLVQVNYQERHSVPGSVKTKKRDLGMCGSVRSKTGSGINLSRGQCKSSTLQQFWCSCLACCNASQPLRTSESVTSSASGPAHRRGLAYAKGEDIQEAAHSADLEQRHFE